MLLKDRAVFRLSGALVLKYHLSTLYLVIMKQSTCTCTEIDIMYSLKGAKRSLLANQFYLYCVTTVIGTQIKTVLVCAGNCFFLNTADCRY